MIVMLGLAPFFALVQRRAAHEAHRRGGAGDGGQVEMGVSAVGFLCGGIKIGLRGIYAPVLLLLRSSGAAVAAGGDRLAAASAASCSVPASPHLSSLSLSRAGCTSTTARRAGREFRCDVFGL